jgi:hypothetical protein
MDRTLSPNPPFENPYSIFHAIPPNIARPPIPCIPHHQEEKNGNNVSTAQTHQIMTKVSSATNARSDGPDTNTSVRPSNSAIFMLLALTVDYCPFQSDRRRSEAMMCILREAFYLILLIFSDSITPYLFTGTLSLLGFGVWSG